MSEVKRWNNIGGEFLTLLNENNEFEYGPIDSEYILAAAYDALAAKLAEAEKDAARYGWLKSKFKQCITESEGNRAISAKGNRVTYEFFKSRFCEWDFQDAWMLCETVEGDGELRTFDAAIDSAMVSERLK